MTNPNPYEGPATDGAPRHRARESTLAAALTFAPIGAVPASVLTAVAVANQDMTDQWYVFFFATLATPFVLAGAIPAAWCWARTGRRPPWARGLVAGVATTLGGLLNCAVVYVIDVQANRLGLQTLDLETIAGFVAITSAMIVPLCVGAGVALDAARKAPNTAA